MGIAIGTAIGVATDNVGIWMCIGIALGAAFGGARAKKNEANKNKE